MQEQQQKAEQAERKPTQLKAAVARKDALLAEMRSKLDAALAGQQCKSEGGGDKSHIKEKLKAMQATITRKDALVESLRKQVEATEKMVRVKPYRQPQALNPKP